VALEKIMLKIKKHISSFFLLWVIVVSVGITTATLLASPLGDLIFKLRGEEWSQWNDGSSENAFALIFLMGLFVAFGQWIVINTKLKKAYNWIPATFFGFLIGGIISSFIWGMLYQIGLALLPSPPKWMDYFSYYYPIANQILDFATPMTTGMIAGMFQWVSLKRKVANSLKWSVITGLSLAIGILPMSLVPRLAQRNYPIIGIITGIVSVLLITSISGYFAESLIIRPAIDNLPQQETAT